MAQKSTTTTWPGKLRGPSVRPSTDGNWKSTLVPGAGGLPAAVPLPAVAPSLQLRRSRETKTAAARTGRQDRSTWEKVVVIMASQA